MGACNAPHPAPSVTPAARPQVFEDDAMTPIVRRGAHKGRVCAHAGCDKFARLSTNGLRKWCITHMREQALMPKDYIKKGDSRRGLAEDGLPCGAPCDALLASFASGAPAGECGGEAAHPQPHVSACWE